MNQDFALLATPANARRLLLFRDICKLDVSSEIVALADRDRLDAQAFDPSLCPYTSTKHTVCQFLLDCGLRGGIQVAYHPEINPLTVLNVVRVAAPNAIVIVTGRRRVWTTAAKAFDLTAQIIGTVHTLEQDLDHVDRRAVVIIDVDDYRSSHLLRNTAREFPRLIVYDNSELARLIPWPVWARLLCPTMPHPLTPRLLKHLPDGWAELPLVAFALFYNICIFPHLVQAPAIRAAMEDDYLRERIKHYSSLLSLTV